MAADYLRSSHVWGEVLFLLFLAPRAKSRHSVVSFTDSTLYIIF